jgi:hypothetical protein
VGATVAVKITICPSIIEVDETPKLVVVVVNAARQLAVMPKATTATRPTWQYILFLFMVDPFEYLRD